MCSEKYRVKIMTNYILQKKLNELHLGVETIHNEIQRGKSKNIVRTSVSCETTANCLCGVAFPEEKVREDRNIFGILDFTFPTDSLVDEND